MNERVTVAQAYSLPLANLVRSQVVKVTKPQGDQAITFDLNNGYGAKLDLSAVANEKMTLVHVDTKLVILFDNQSTVTAEPFFDLSGKPLANLNVELSAGHTLNGEQFAQSVPITDDQSVLPATDPSSGADFHDVSIESLTDSSAPLTLMAQDMPEAFGRSGAVGEADFGVFAHAQQLVSTSISTVIGSAPSIGDIPAPGGAGTQVFEAGLLASRGTGEFDGTQAGNPAFQTTTRAGTISFSSPDGLQSVSLGGNIVTATTQADAQAHPFADGTTGSLAAWVTFDSGLGRIHYIYTLLDNTVGVPNTSFAVVVTDPDGDQNPPANLVISIVDDGPIAVGDTDAVGSGQIAPQAGDVIHGPGADVPGADGGLTVVSATGNGNPVAVTAAGSQITGGFGTLTLFSDGHYSYLHTGAPGGGTDTFSYTVTDADGSPSTATLQIAVGDSAPGNISVPTDVGMTTVFEAGLLASRGPGESAGSDAGNPDGNAPTTTQTGKITFTSVDGVGSLTIGGQAVHLGETKLIADGTTGQLNVTSVTYNTANGTGELDYTYTLLDNTAAVNGGDTVRSFTVAVTDADGSTTQGNNLVIAIRDDHPTANADTDLVVAGQLGVEQGDVLDGTGTTSNGADVVGADGPALGGAVVGVAFNGVAGTVGQLVHGTFGDLTLFADGHYNYQRNFGVAGQPDHVDIFNYTIQDGDGSQASATLTITVKDSVPGGFQIPTEGDAQTTVFEAALPARGNEPAGSNPNPQFASAKGTIDFASVDGVASVTVGGQVLHIGETATILDGTTGQLDITSVTYDTQTGLGQIKYTYTLLDNTIGNPAANVTGDTSASFAVAVTDLDSSTTQGGNLVIDIVDDQPQAISDVVSLTAGQSAPATGNVILGDGVVDGVVADKQGADSATVISVAFGNLVKTVDPTGITSIIADHGTLTIDALGNFSYTRTSGGSDIFTYTIRDGDGDVSSAQLTVQISDSVPSNIVIPQVGGADTTVNEAALLASRGPGESAGSHAGDTTGFPVTTQTGAITFTSPDGVSKIELGGLVIDATTTAPGTPVPFTDSTGTLTAFYTIDQPGAYTIHFTYTLLDNTDAQTTPSVHFPVAITDLDGERTQSSSDLVITINDDNPIANADAAEVAATDSQASGTVITNDVLGADGPKSGGALVGVAAGSDPGTPIAGGINTQITGSHGTLTIDAQGTYTYLRNSSGVDIFTYTIQDGDGSHANATLTFTVDNAVPGVLNIPQVGNAGAGTLVDEAGLPFGSNPAATTERTTGAITFTSLDGVGSITLVDNANPSNTIVLDSNNPQRGLVDATGFLVASYTIDPSGSGTINYSYTLLQNTNATTTPSVSFGVTVTDTNGDPSGGTLSIAIKDDAPIAKADTDHLTATDVTGDGNVITGANTTTVPPGVDLFGADGQKPGGALVGMAAGADPGTPIIGGLNTPITGAHGTLAMDQFGNYTYVRTSSGVDTFTYTIQDGDGSQSNATLTFTIDNAVPGPINFPQVGVAGAGTLVDEAGLATGSNPAATSETTTGVIRFTSLDGVGSITIADPGNSGNFIVLDSGHTSGTLNAGPGTLHASYLFGGGSGIINYTYTLLQPTSGDQTVNGGDTATSFNVTLVDSNSDQSSGALVIDIKDDKPVARADTDLVVSGQLGVEHGDVVDGSGTTSGVVDVFGADGAASGGAAVGVSFDGTAGTLGQVVHGRFGDLTLFADGHYNYQRFIGAAGADDHIDTFNYTIQDGDGSQATATLTITVANSTPGGFQIPDAGDADAVVFEAGLPARGSEPAGSNSLDQIKATGAIEFTSADGVASVTVAGQVIHLGETATIADGTSGRLDITSVTYNAGNGVGEIDYTYTLLDNTIGNPAVNNGDTSASFAVAVTDLDGSSTTGGNLVIEIVDDKPVARPDTDAVAANQTTAETGNVITGAGTGGGPNGTGVDIKGADDATVISIGLHGTNTVVAVDPLTGGSITTTHGTLTIDAHGNYSYVRSSGGTDVFDYTLADGDGSQSTSTLTIVVGDSAPNTIVVPQTGGADTTVFEAGLPARVVNGVTEPAGSHTGDAANFPVTTQAGTISFSSPDGLSKIQVGGLVIDATLTPPNSSATFTDTTGSLTAFYTIGQSGAYTIHYTYTLLDNTLGDPSSVTLPVIVTDRDGDTNQQSASLVINAVDDGPTGHADTDNVAAGQASPEIGNVINGAGPGGADVRGADDVQVVGTVVGAVNSNVVDANTVGNAVQGLFGKLTLNADGSYHYDRNIDVPGDNSHIDTFSYTLRDGDGDMAHSMLTVGVADSVPSFQVTSGLVLVYEAGLPSGSHLGPSGAPNYPTTAAGTISFTSVDGVGFVSLGGHTITGTPTTFTDALGAGTMTASYSYNAANGEGIISYSYHLVNNTQGSAAVQSFFDLAMTDLDGDTILGGHTTFIVNIVDDNPVARDDSFEIPANQSRAISGNVITEFGPTSDGADVPGADGIVVCGVVAGGGGPLDLPNTLGVPIAGPSGGILTLFADGQFTFNPGSLPNGGFTTFTYTIKDSDAAEGSLNTGLSTATIFFSKNDTGGIVASSGHIDNKGTEPLAVSSLNVGVGTGDDILTGGSGSDTLTGGGGANHFQFNSPLDGGTIGNQAGADHIVDFNAAKGDVIDILGAAFGNLAPNTNVAAIFGSSATDAFASPAERIHFNTETHTLLYDSNGNSAGGVQTALAVFDNHAIVAATNIHVI